MNVRWEASNLTTLGGSLVLGLLAAVSITGLVFSGVSLFLGARGPEGAEIVGWIGGAVCVVFGVLTFVFARRNGARVRAGWDGEALRLEIRSPSGEVSHRGPFRVEHGWTREQVATGRGSIGSTVLVLAVRDERGRALLYLREQLGAMYSPPSGWSERHVQVSECPHVYTNTLGRIHLDRLASALAGAR